MGQRGKREAPYKTETNGEFYVSRHRHGGRQGNGERHHVGRQPMLGSASR